MCGGVLVEVQASPSEMQSSFSVWLGSMEIYGRKLAGLGGTYDLNAAWSLDSAWEKLTRNSKTRNLVLTIAEYVDRLEAEGKIVRASMVKKKALLAAKSGRIGLVVSPGL